MSRATFTVLGGETTLAAVDRRTVSIEGIVYFQAELGVLLDVDGRRVFRLTCVRSTEWAVALGDAR